MRRTLLIAMSGLFVVGATQADAQIFHKKKKLDKSTTSDNNQQPDKVLYDRSIEDIKHGKHEIGRLNLQTLINTYPDSDYLAKAKLAIADSYFKEGGTANMTQAIQGYKDFIVFFPFLPEAPYAQLQVANAHYRQMEKPDRDRTDARAAEEEFQTFLTKYPKDPLADKAAQKLRDIQEVLAEGDYRIAYYYYVKGDKRAAASRLISVTNRYPLYSRSDHALFMLGGIFETSERKEIAASYYAKIVRDYPLSPLVGDAKTKLTAFKVPIPQPDPKAVEWMTAEANAPREKQSMMKMPLLFFKGGPTQELQASSRLGVPNLTPEADTSSGVDILKGGGTPRLGNGGSGIVATIVPGQPVETGGAVTGSSVPTTGGAVETVENPTGEAVAPAATTPPSTGDPAAPANSNGTAAPGADANVPPTGTATGAPLNSDAPPAATSGDNAASTDNSATNAAANNGKESTSKKKKGIKKIVPW